MKIFERFIIDLLQNGMIVNYTSSKQDVKKFYIAHYRRETTLSFHRFCYKLWHMWYILDFRKNFIYFDQRWVNYFNKFTNAELVTTKYKLMLIDKLCNKERCNMCLVKFSSEEAYKKHCQELQHKVRVQYLINKDSLKNIGQMKVLLLKKPNVDQNGRINYQFNRHEEYYKTLDLENRTNMPIEIIEVVKINPYLHEVSIAANFKKGVPLQHKEQFTISIKAVFQHSKSFTMPVVVVCKFCGSKELSFIMLEVLVEVSSSFSSLKSDLLPCVKPLKTRYPLPSEVVILGELPLIYTSYYKEKFHLKTYEIPIDLLMSLKDLVTMFPNFTERMPLNAANKFFYDKFTEALGLNPNINEENYCSLLNTLVNIEENQIMIDIRQYDTVSKLKFVGGNTYELRVPGLAEARPSLVIHDSVFVKTHITDCYKYQGIVSQVLESSVRLSFSSGFKEAYNRNITFHIEFGYNRRPFRVQKQALFLVKEFDIVSYLFPKDEPYYGYLQEEFDESIEYFNPDLNREQKSAITNILKERSAPYLIFGPPGTGKTVTVIEAVLQIWKTKPGARILVCTPSNAATDEIAIRLAGNMDADKEILRLIGNAYCLERKLSQLENIANIKDKCFYMPSMETILRYRILVTTLVTAARLVNGGVPDGHYSHVFIDESGYATESESLIPIAGILSNSSSMGRVVGQVVLAGDPRQLGPVVHSNFAKYCGFGRSMLERLLDTCDLYSRNEIRPVPYNEKYVTKLVKNYRSHEEILKVPNKLFYHDELISVGNSSSNMFVYWEHLPTPGFPVIFHHTVGEDSRESISPSFFNIQEIEIVMEYITKLLGSCVNGTVIVEDDIGIITPYKKQVKFLKQACGAQGWSNLLVGSVEQFQGNEKLIIIISTVRSKNYLKYEEIDMKCRLGFLRNPKRFNVALTRAKALLIVVGNGDVLKNDKNWLHFLEYCIRKKAVVGSQFHLSDDEYLTELTDAVEIDCNKAKKE
ncbi:hypothetical protein NQ315_004138 [Exocentrus adspersus]|uniref:RNA helicase n=1 Tax=Exocentrus adspersus TaxID=1586481 RepID=A0AAV8W6E9_9CUCU|nr:hypothetical protein NQ315_004138 [Exocentrus adspersus]